MDTLMLEEKFERMGARVKINAPETSRLAVTGDLRIDIRRDHRGEFFDLRVNPSLVDALTVLDVQPKQRHLLLMAAHTETENGSPVVRKERFLCGHDERSWFVAAVPGRSASNVQTAFEVLKPPSVRASQAQQKLPLRQRNRRKNRAFVRQGEWFFTPAPGFRVEPKLVLRHEPIRRGGGKAHWVEFLYRTGGETVYVNPRFPNGLTVDEHADWVRRNPSAKDRWNVMVRNAGVYVRGRISHPDHNTITLHDWHRVEMNTENQARAMRNVAFLD